MSIAPLLLEGVALLACESLRGAHELLPLPQDVEAAVEDALGELPQQWHTIGSWEQSGRWIDFAALLEAHGQWDAAWDVVAILRAVVENSDAPRNLAAFLSARHGRIARQAGRLDTADACYAAALSSADRFDHTFWTDVYPSAWLGRSVLAAERGNYPLARRCARRALKRAVPAAHRAQAHQMLALIERKAGLADKALSHLWQAHDLCDGHPAHRNAVLGALADVVAAHGEACAALRAWTAILRDNQAPRLVTPALVHVLDTLERHVLNGDPCGQCATLLRGQPWAVVPEATASLEAIARALVDQTASAAVGTRPLKEMGSPLTPHDHVELQLARSRVLKALGAGQLSAEVARDVQREAVRHGFHERAFQAEPLVAPPVAAPKQPPIPRAASASLRRFFDLELQSTALEESHR